VSASHGYHSVHVAPKSPTLCLDHYMQPVIQNYNLRLTQARDRVEFSSRHYVFDGSIEALSNTFETSSFLGRR